MFKRRRLSTITPTKRPVRVSSRTTTPTSSSSSSSSSQKTQKTQILDDDDDDDDDDNQYLRYLQEQDGDEDEFSDYAPDSPESPNDSPSALKVVYIVAQSSTESDPEPSSSSIFECNDKVISVHTTKSSANAAAKRHLRKLCGIKSSKDAKKMEENGEGEYHEGVGTRSLFVGSMKREEGVVRVQTQWWKVKK